MACLFCKNALPVSQGKEGKKAYSSPLMRQGKGEGAEGGGGGREREGWGWGGGEVGRRACLPELFEETRSCMCKRHKARQKGKEEKVCVHMYNEVPDVFILMSSCPLLLWEKVLPLRSFIGMVITALFPVSKGFHVLKRSGRQAGRKFQSASHCCLPNPITNVSSMGWRLSERKRGGEEEEEDEARETGGGGQALPCLHLASLPVWEMPCRQAGPEPCLLPPPLGNAAVRVCMQCMSPLSSR